MKPSTFFRKNLDYGDRCAVKLARPSYYKDREMRTVTLFFHGYRILCGSAVSDGPRTLVPVFNIVTKKGTMGRRHYGNGSAPDEIATRFEYIISVKKIPQDEDSKWKAIKDSSKAA